METIAAPRVGQLEWAVDVITSLGEGADLSPELIDAAFATAAEWGILDTILFPPVPYPEPDPEPDAAPVEAAEPVPDYWAWGWFFSYLYGAKMAADAGTFSRTLEAGIQHAQEHGFLDEALRLGVFRDVLGVDPFAPAPALN